MASHPRPSAGRSGRYRSRDTRQLCDGRLPPATAASPTIPAALSRTHIGNHHHELRHPPPTRRRARHPRLIRRFAIQAEALGFADVWVSEHIILPRTQFLRPLPFYEPILTLTWVAAITERVRLGTSVLVLPMRHPIPLAKELATLQNLSDGRLILGAGVGWLAPSSPPSARRSTSAAAAWTKASR